MPTFLPLRTTCPRYSRRINSGSSGEISGETLPRIALDAMGGDGAPRVIIEGALSAVREWPNQFRVLLVGIPESLRPELPSDIPDGVEIVSATEVVEPHESPVRAIRRKPDSSIVVGLGLLQQGAADAFISAGSTGAVMAASRLFLGMVPGLERPTVGTMFPTAGSDYLEYERFHLIDTIAPLVESGSDAGGTGR